MKKITIEVEVADDVTEEQIIKKIKEPVLKKASFASRKRISWISFLVLISLPYINTKYQFQNENIVEVIAFGLFSIVLGYFGTATYEFVKLKGGKDV